MNMRSRAVRYVAVFWICSWGAATWGQSSAPATTMASSRPTTGPASQPIVVPDLKTLLSPKQSEMVMVAERYDVDRRTLGRFYDLPLAASRIERLRKFDQGWMAALGRIHAEK